MCVKRERDSCSLSVGGMMDEHADRYSSGRGDRKLKKLLVPQLLLFLSVHFC